MIASTTDDSALYPIVQFFHTTMMNILTPDFLVSLYPQFTFERAGLISHSAYLNQDTISGPGPHTLCYAAAQSMEMLSRLGYLLTDNPEHIGIDHLSQCKRKCCRLTWYSDDRKTLVLTFGHRDIIDMIEPPIFPVVGWSLGGYECGQGPYTGVYESSMSSIL